MRYILLLILILLTPLSAYAEERKTTLKDIPYIKGSNLKKHTLDLYLPAQKTKNAPVHIFVHGGAWNFGDKKSVKAKEAKAYTDQGVILVVPSYRLSPEFQHPAHVQDVAASISWVHKNISKYGGNPQNMVLSGHSAGGHLVALVGTDAQYLAKYSLKPNIFKAIATIDHSKYDLNVVHKGPLTRTVKKWTKNAFGTNPENLTKASPIHQDLSQDLSPFLVFAAAKRKHAVAHSGLFTQTLKEHGKQAELLLIENHNHMQMKRTLFKSKSEMFKKIISVLN